MKQNWLTLLSLLGVLVTIVAVIVLYQKGYFTDASKLENVLEKLGIWAPIIFILVQIIQVVIPIIPGGITLAVGVVVFGPVMGFIYNYVGIVVGSIILFLLGRKFGKPMVEQFVSQKIQDKYLHRLDSPTWTKTFAVLIVAPIAPDDALVLLTSVTNMSFKTFFWIIVLGKPLSVLAYSFALANGIDWLTKLIGS